MEFLSSSSTIFAFLSLFLLSLLWMSFTYVLQSRDRQKKSSPPEPAGAWPLIGHLPLLGGPNPAHITLGNMADKYGTLFKIQLGVYPTLVVSGWEVAKECLTTHDRVLAARPKSLVGEIMGYGFTMFGFSTYGPYWRQVRKTATVELLSNHKLELLKHVREFEVKTCTKEIHDLWEEKKPDPGPDSDYKVLVEMERWFGDVTMNLMFRVVFGKRFMKTSTVEADKENKEICWKAVKQFFKLAGEFALADAVPFLRWLDFGGIEKAMKKTAEDFNGMLQGWLEEHKQKRSGDGEHDFMDMMLSVVDDDSAQDRHGFTTADTITKSTCLAILLGGTDTTTVTLTWALSLLLNNREALKKAQDELDNNVGRERQVQESDLTSLVYLQAIIKETMRLYPAAPLSVPHEAAEDCTIGGYNVPAGTRFIFNLTKIMSDPNVWVDPAQFRPERFLTTQKDFDVRGQNFEFIPFGSGRRMCPGISLALQVMQLTLAQLLHGFEISATSADGGVDMGLTPGLTIMRKTPLKVLLRPRLQAKVYEC